jgi:glycosyltransferase involved in cell wall biosynthesis
MKKILINFLFGSPKESGIFRTLFYLLKYLHKISQKNVEYYFVTSSTQFENIEGVYLIKREINKKIESLKSIQIQFLLYDLIKKLKPDLILNPYHIGYLLPLDIPQITFLHDIILLTSFKRNLFLYFYQLIIFKRLVNNSKFIITPSMTSKKDIVSFFKIPEKKVKVVYWGVDKEKFKNLNLQKENFYLIVNATFPYKNVDYVIKLWRKFDIKENLIIVGYYHKYIKYHNYLKELTKKLNLENKIIFYPKVTDEELIELYNKAKALISPSLKEGFGLPPLEALSCGTPVILSDIPVYKEIYGDIGIFFDLNNDESFLFALEKLKNLNKEEFEEKRKEFIKKFDWQKTAEEVYKIIKDALII